jgi:hypothetical protein
MTHCPNMQIRPDEGPWIKVDRPWDGLWSWTIHPGVTKQVLLLKIAGGDHDLHPDLILWRDSGDGGWRKCKYCGCSVTSTCGTIAPNFLCSNEKCVTRPTG